MSKITEYTSASTFDANDVLLKDGENGTMIISVEDAASELKRLSGVDDDISGVTQTVTQRIDTIASDIAGVETDYIASKDYAIGDLFIVNNVLYKATAAIAEEDIIDTETNCAIVNLGDEIGDIRSELLNKANVDGSYDEFTAGSSKQLLGTVFIEDDEPYLFRTSGGSIDIGDREYDEIVGGSIVWNQLVPISEVDKSITRDDLTIIDNRDGSFTAKTESSGANTAISVIIAVDVVEGHKYLFKSCLSNGSPTTFHSYIINNYDYGNGAIAVAINSGSVNVVIIIKQGAVISTPIVFKPQLFDLTQMFGSEIADYIYNLEQTTPGAGVAWFRKYFPKDYYEYNAGELMHVSDLQSHDTVRFNLLNLNDVGTIIKDYRVFDLPIGKNSLLKMEFVDKDTSVDVSNINFGFLSSSYNGRTPVPNIDEYKWVLYTGTIRPDNSNALQNGTLFDRAFMYPNSDEAFDKIKRRYDICVHLVWDGERDGEYEPYVKRSYPLDSSLTLRGIPKLSTDGKLYYDGDHYKSDGTVERRYGIVDLGTLRWSYSNGQFYSNMRDLLIKAPSAASIIGNAMCVKYTTIAQAGAKPDKYLFVSYPSGMLYIVDSDYASAADFKAAMSGVYLIYELVEPTTEEAQPFQSPQIVDDFGTEEYVTSSIVPVGHTTQYDHNLRAKLEMAPNSPDGDGDYLVRQTGSKNEYVPYTDGGRITALEGKIPAAPSANGSYILKCTVTDGTATYAWVAE